MKSKKGNKLFIGAPIGSTISIEIKVLPPIRVIGGSRATAYCNKSVSSFGSKTC